MDRHAPSLQRMFAPASIAVIGGDWSANVVGQLRKSGFGGDIWPVHPRRAEMHGIACFADLDALPRPPDAVHLAVNREATIPMLARLRDAGAGGVVCFASGFAESEAEVAGGAGLQTALIDAAGSMPVLGPNCYGFCNYLDNATVWPDQHGGVPVAAGVAIVTQSSNLAINLTMQRRGLPLGFIATAGNQAVTSQAQIAAHLIDDPRVTAIGLHVEGFADLSGFETLAARAKALGKPVVVLKVGRSQAAMAQTVSHTASLAGTAAGASALIKRLGFVEVPSLPVFVETLKLLHVHGPLPGNRIASLSCSGGEAGLVADLAESRDLVLPELNEAQRTGLRAALGERVALANPLDYHTYVWGDAPRMQAAFAAMMDAPLDLAMLTLDWPRPDRCSATGWDIAVETFGNAAAASGTRAAIVSILPENLTEETATELVAQGVAPLCGIDDAIVAIEAAARAGQRLGQPAVTLLGAPQMTGKPALLSEAEAKAALGRHGVPVPHGIVIRPDELQSPLLPPFPLALKATGMAHKSDAGGVRLGLTNQLQFETAARELFALSPQLLAEQMIENPVCELLVGIVRDPAHGLVLTLGAGGIHAELLRDTQSLLLPTSGDEIEAKLRALAIWPRIEGWRDTPAGDARAVIDAILALAEYAVAHAADLFEVEINPLIVCQRGAFAADALIRLASTTAEPKGETS